MDCDCKGWARRFAPPGPPLAIIRGYLDPPPKTNNSLNLSAIFSKTGKGVQEASGKTNHLSRGDRTVLSAIDGKTSLAEVQRKFEKLVGPKFEALIQQLDKDGYIREVSSGAAQPAAPAARTSAPPPRAAPAPPKAPAASGGDDEGLDFTQSVKLPPKPAAPSAPKAAAVDLAATSRAEADRKAKEQAFDYKARQEADVKAKAEAEVKARAAAEARTKAEAEGKARAEAEAKAREAAEARGRAEADTKTRAESDAKVKAAREAALRMAAEAKAKTDAATEREREANERARKEAEAKARLEAELTGKLEEERKARREVEEKAKRDAEELRERLEAEMKAKLDEERKKREEEDRKRREEEYRRRKEEDERRAKEEAERRAKEDADRRAREEEDRKRRKEEDERRAKEDADRRAKQDAERRGRDDDERRNREEAERRAKDEAEAKARASQSASLPSINPAAPTPPPAAVAGGDIGDSLLADLDSFTQREDEEAKAKEEAERNAKEHAARRAKEEAERKAKDEADKKRREQEERRRKEEEERRAQQEADRQAKEEEEQREQEAAERKRKAKEALAAKQDEEKGAQMAAQRTAAGKKGAGDDDIGVTDDDLGMDDIKRDQKALAKTARKVALEQPAVAARRPKKWGKPAAMALFVLLIGGVGALHVMPISTAEYEKAASEAMGVPVKIDSARLSIITGVEVRFETVSVGDAVKIKLVRGFPEIGSLFGATKAFSRMELEGVSVSQSQLADAVLGKVSGQNFRVGRVVIRQAKLDGPLTLPPLDVEATVSGDGSLQSVTLRDGDRLSVQLSPKGNDIGFEISAGSLALPFVPALTLSDFGMKGSANRQGVVSSEFDGRAFDGVISGTAKIRWGANWNVDGEVRARGVKVAVFAPALVSEGRIGGRAAYSMSGGTPAKLFETARVQGEFKIEKGVLGSFDLTRALQTGGAQTGGRTVFSELTGQGLYDKGAIQIRNVAITTGAMNAGANLDVDANGGLSGRITADVKTPTQTLRATLNLSGKVQDPVIRK